MYNSLKNRRYCYPHLQVMRVRHERLSKLPNYLFKAFGFQNNNCPFRSRM